MTPSTRTQSGGWPFVGWCAPAPGGVDGSAAGRARHAGCGAPARCGSRPSARVWRHLDAQYVVLSAAQEMRAEANGADLVVVVAHGAIGLRELGKRVGAIAALHFVRGEAAVLHGLESSTLLLAITAVAGSD
jgi:hypothetical protein